ncbi:PH domain-containing protein [Kitasatospora sp. NA04385]|uniref:PH domain-containing protein n=1 Tax=Kitasatospora sp. NA04385 TaxID=2742135 RepID=UPI0015905C90|nr:PH domain-containing protein [Kitasatospora sp. NA04385]QKW19849.1 PH domain-containing protein [Kitasatospora sp. NA04385]
MTESDRTPHQGSAADEPVYADRVYRSVPSVVAGAMMLAVAAWLITDAVVTGSGATPWVALAAAPVFAFPVIAYTLRPVVRANDRRLVVRNPLRTIVAPWSKVEGLKAGYSVELFADGRKFQVWAIPVSIRQRKKATRRATRAVAEGDPALRSPARPGKAPRTPRPDELDSTRAWSDAVVNALQEQAERNAHKASAAGEVTATWCWWVIAPTLAGLVALVAVVLAI